VAESSATRRSLRWHTGWVAVLLSTTLSAVWAFWGSIENFHEGWYYRELSRNLLLASVQYLPWMFLPMVAALLALWRPWIGLLAHFVLAAGAIARFGTHPPAGLLLIALPLAVLGILYAYGRPTPARLARCALIFVPLATVMVSGAYPGWRAITRPKTVDSSMRAIAGNGVALTWAPAGPGFNHLGLSWVAAKNTCAALTEDGQSLASTPLNIWRLPTVDEAVRTMSFRGRNAGGTWDAATETAHFDVMPDKEAPLWDPFSQVIYWWTSDEVDVDRAYRVVYNGQVTPLLKRISPAYLSCRCVKSTSLQATQRAPAAGARHSASTP
jgi:hypothetical protein